MAKITGKSFTYDPFLIRDKNGFIHWYRKDPMKAENREETEISIEEEIMSLVGTGTIANPVMVHITCARVNRSEAFNISQPAEVRRSGSRHFEDLTGTVIDILEVRNSSPQFPLSGVVFNSRGDIIGNRRYSEQGVCEDGVEDHAIVIVNGPAVFEADVRGDVDGSSDGVVEPSDGAPVE